jgi:protein-disulfide isomerase
MFPIRIRKDVPESFEFDKQQNRNHLIQMKRELSSGTRRSKLVVPDADRDHIQGPVNAPMALVEYGDYQCPYCGDAHPIVKALQKRLGNKLCFAFRNFPLTEAHAHAEHAAEAAEAADAQGRFWEMHDLLFENQEALEDEALVEYASSLGLDASRLISEVQSGAHRARILEDYRSGEKNGVDGTPFFFVNGVRYEGEPELNALLSALAERSAG